MYTYDAKQITTQRLHQNQVFIIILLCLALLKVTYTGTPYTIILNESHKNECHIVFKSNGTYFNIKR